MARIASARPASAHRMRSTRQERIATLEGRLVTSRVQEGLMPAASFLSIRESPVMKREGAEETDQSPRSRRVCAI